MNKRTGSELIRVSNTAQGRKEIAIVKEIFKNTNFNVTVRGRHPNRRRVVESAGITYNRSHRHDISVYLAKELAVYIKHKRTGEHLLDVVSKPTQRDKELLLYREINDLKWEIHNLKNEKARLENTIESIKDLVK